jgi:restriction endonuclease
VQETKGSGDVEERRGLENMKIACARRHFAALHVDHDVMTGAEALRGKVSTS